MTDRIRNSPNPTETLEEAFDRQPPWVKDLLIAKERRVVLEHVALVEQFKCGLSLSPIIRPACREAAKRLEAEGLLRIDREESVHPMAYLTDAGRAALSEGGENG